MNHDMRFPITLNISWENHHLYLMFMVVMVRFRCAGWGRERERANLSQKGLYKH